MTCVERYNGKLLIRHLQHHVDLGFSIDDAPGMWMEGKLHTMFERALANLVQILREDPGVCGGQILRTAASVEIGFERLDAEIGREFGIGAIAVQRRLQLARVEVLPAACDRRNADS